MGCCRIRTRSRSCARRCRRAGGGRRAPAAAGCRRCGRPRAAAPSTSGADEHRRHDEPQVRHRVVAAEEQREGRRGGGERGEDAAHRHRLPRHERGPRRAPEALLAGHETRGHPREEHRERREDERDHGLHGGRRRATGSRSRPDAAGRRRRVGGQRRRMTSPPGAGGRLVLGPCLDLGERGLDVVQLVGGRTVEEVQQRRSAVGDLHVVEGAEHRLGGERLTGVGGEVAPGAAVALAGHEVLLREPVEHGHHGRVGDLALALEAVVHLAHRGARRTTRRRRSRPPRGAP